MQSDKILLLGVNHTTTPVEVREKIALSQDYEFHLDLLKELEGVKEHYLLSTCNRVELPVVVEAGVAIRQQLIHFLFGEEVSLEEAAEYLYILEGSEAVRHLFMVAGSLDSMIVGEAQILGQLKEAYRFAARLGSTGPLLNKLLHKSFSVAKRVRSETGIGSSAVSISYAAVQLARKIFGSLAGKKVLLIGAGEMAELAAEHLVGQGVASVTVANRTLAKAMTLAAKFHGQAVSMEELPVELAAADIIISSTGAPGLIIMREDVKKVMRARMNRPLFLIDIAVPRDLDPQLNELDNVYLYDIDDLSSVVETNRQERDREAVKARRIVDEETVKFEHYLETLAVTPTILEVRKCMEEMALGELRKVVGKMDLAPEEVRALEGAVLAISAKVLHHPMQYLKSNSCTGKRNMTVRVNTVRELFGLPESAIQKQQDKADGKR